MKNRVGRFKVSNALIDSSPENIMLIMEGVLVIRAECIHYPGVIEYIGLSEHFREVSEGEAIPEYIAECTVVNTPGGIGKGQDLQIKWAEQQI